MIFDTGATGRVAVADDVALSFEWWPGAGPVVCIHGLTSHRRAFAALADELAPRTGILSFDLRGRGDSHTPPEVPFGMDRHARDVAAALDALGFTEPVVLAGHSMGAYVLTTFARLFPERLRAAILLDGGYFLKPPGSADLALMEEMLGPFLERLRVQWPNVDAVVDAFAATPLYEGRVDDAARRYFAFDVAGEPGALRAKAAMPAVRHDWTEIVRGERTLENLRSVRCPTLLVRARGGLTGTGDEVVPDEVLEKMLGCIPDLQVVSLEQDNHHTMLTTRPGAARTAAAVARFLEALEG